MKIKRDELSLAVRALRKTGFRYGMYAFVTGCDGLSCTIGALLLRSGAAGVTMGALSRDDEIKAERLGFSVYSYGRDNLDKARKLTGGRLYDLVYETTGKTAAYDAFIDMLKRGGAVGILARLDESYTFYVKTAVRSQIRFVGLRSFDEQSAKIANDLLERNWGGSE
jgi:threonine dehydrogenase-like Zn-dependent dehydrogenase